METKHDEVNCYYDIIPEKYASFSERKLNTFMFEFCNSIGLKGQSITAIEQLKHPHMAYRVFYELHTREE